MSTVATLKECTLSLAVFHDARESMKHSHKGQLIPEDAEIDEYQFYLQKVGFHLAHSLTWMTQLDLALELLTNYDYSKRITASRADHLIYNTENYLIRLNSTYDRMLQLTNAVFHLCLNEEHVSHSVIITNTKVEHRPKVVTNLKAIKKHLEKYAQDRHTIVHKHSLLDERLRRIELFYQDGLLELMPAERSKIVRLFRANYLREYVIEKKAEFREINAKLVVCVGVFFQSLLFEYEFQKKQFKARGF